MDTLLSGFVDGVLVPLIDAVTAPIPFLASSGILLGVFAAIWALVGFGIVRRPARVDGAWRRLRRLPLVVQAIAGVLLLPVVAGVALWRAPWPRAARALGVLGIAVWNLFVLVPAA
jgi:hypothetical protein